MSSSESAVAWDLVDVVRATLSIAELNAVFVRLGAGEDRAAICRRRLKDNPVSTW